MHVVHTLKSRLIRALGHDQSINSNPIVNIENNGNKTVTGHSSYGSSNIIYSKGCIILKMIRCYLGDNVFFGGLQAYLEQFKYSNPTTFDLFSAWDQAAQSSPGSETTKGLGFWWSRPVAHLHL